MERLTFESDGYFAVRGKDCFDDQDENYCGPAIDRLAAYEDTGLTPGDVVDLMGNHGMALSELAKVPKWIPVTERLPEEDERVLVYLSPKDFTYTRIDTDRLLFGKWTRWGKRVSHWMPLPQAPRKESS